LVKSITMIPGSGEYVYDTKIQYKHNLRKINSGRTEYISSSQVLNSHNHYKIANSVHSLNQLQATCQNIKWVAPVVCWFGDNVDAKYCKIRPAIEFRDDYTSYSEEWRVGRYDRQSAYSISKDQSGNPQYGGSVNDASIIRYLEEIKSRNLKIMFYPMFLLDVEQKPWRGRVTSSPEHIRDFFRREEGYNNFILHYANLVKNHADAFIIGSELIGLTKIKDNDNSFPAVDELVRLAERVKQIVGPNVLVTYAADWSEYHHTEGGWFNLDPLWASPNIDFIGIDAYFPVTDTNSSIITAEEITNGWITGEGYDYYIDRSNGFRYDLSAQYAWKNIKHWWKNTHTNPDGNKTKWQPCSKKIWFTEFGFPSIDKATNQPNVFFDPRCIDGGVPRNSRGTIDFSVQRKAIRAFIEYWESQEYIGECFLWTWDARPYPAWPHSSYWGDGNLWEKGHWVNNKFGVSSVASILLEISQRCGIDIRLIDVSTVDEPIEGMIFSTQITALNAINTLRTSHFFDICADDREFISFPKRGVKKEISINSKNCLKLSDNNFVEAMEIPEEVILGKIDLHFINHNAELDGDYIFANNEKNSFTARALIHLPLVITEREAQNIGNLILRNAAIENQIIRFNLDYRYFTLIPSDFVLFQHRDTEYSIRIIDTKISQQQISVVGIIDDRNCYFQVAHARDRLDISYSDSSSAFVVLDLSFELEENNVPYIGVFLRNNEDSILYTKFPDETDDKWHNIATLKTML